MALVMSSVSTYREVTVGAVLLGVIQGAIMTAAFVYIGLKLGFGLPGSTVAAIMGFALLFNVEWTRPQCIRRQGVWFDCREQYQSDHRFGN